MTKTELIGALSGRTGVSKADVTRVVDALFAPDDGVIAETLGRGERVQLTGFGTFEVRDRAARTGRNPRDGSEIQIPATRAPAFKPGKGLKDAL